MDKETKDTSGGREPVEVAAVNPNTRIKLLRGDVDVGFSLADLEKGEPRDRLLVFAKRQIETCPLEVIGSEENRQRFQERLADQHPVDIVPHMIVMEPCLMISNLTEAQLLELESELSQAETRSNQGSVFGAVSMIQGVLIGRARHKQE